MLICVKDTIGQVNLCNFEPELKSKFNRIRLFNNAFISFIIITFALSFNIVRAQEVPVVDDDPKNSTKTTEEEITITRKEGQLEDKVEYKAQEISNDFPEKMSYLIKDAQVKYEDIQIDADYISINWDTGDVYARSQIDSLGNIINHSVFQEAGKEYKYESFTYNFNTKKGIVYNARLKEGEGMINAQKSKKENDSIFYLKNGFYTTDIYYIEGKDSIPNYILAFDKIKYIDKKVAIAGPTTFYLEQVPTPLMLPFLFIPMSKERSAGVIIPSYGERESQGFFLQGFGFFVPIGEFFNLEVTGDVYTKGSWGTHARSSYYKKYKYRGNFAFNYETRILGIKGQPDFSKSKLYNLTWSHSQDAKSNPYLNFSSSVSFSSNEYFRNSINNNNIINGQILNNTTSSSIALTKRFENFPMTLSLNSSFNQNFNQDQATLNLPTFTANLKQLYPLKKVSKNDLVRSFYFNYRMNAVNTLSGSVDNIFSAKSFKEARNGIRQNISTGTGTTLFNYFPINFNANYNEVWGFKTVEKYYDSVENKVITNDVNGFATYRTFNVGANLNWQLYGTKIFGEGKKIYGIRHTISPSIGWSLTPDFANESFGYYDTFRNANGVKELYSRFENNAYGSPGQGLANNLNFGIQNNLEMKVRSKKDSLQYEKIKIFDFFNLTTSYNMAADSLKWDDINISGATSFLDNKVRVNFSSRVSFYKKQFDSPTSNTGYYVDEFGDISISTYRISLNFGLNNDMFGEPIDYAQAYNKTGKIRYEKYYFDDQNYARFAIPWDLSVGLQYVYNQGLSRTATKSASVNIRGTIQPTPYWSISGNTNYDIESQKIGLTTLTLSRDLRSFSFNFTWVPIGNNKTWNFFIGISATILRDTVKYEERNFNTNSNF